jgi:hypothetical protein
VFFEFCVCIVLVLFLSCCTQLVSACSDDEEPPKDTTAAPLTPPVADDEPPAQEIALRITRASVKKIPVTRSLKRSKKAKEANVSLEAHESLVSPQDVSECP